MAKFLKIYSHTGFIKILLPLIPFLVYKTPGLTPGRGQNIYNCDYNQPPPKGQVCDVDIKTWSPCTKENNYSYHKSSPCIFLKLNKIYDWVPDFYNSSRDLPAKMPDNLKTYIAGMEKTEPHKVVEAYLFLYAMIIIYIHSFSSTQSGCPARVRIQLIRRTLDRLTICPFAASPATSIRTRTPRAT